MSGWTSNLVAGVAELLAAGGAGVWDPDGGVYAPDAVGITQGTIPQSPDRIVCLTPYPVSEEPGSQDVIVSIQVRCRGTRDPSVVDDLADAVRELLHGLTSVVLGGIGVSQVWRNSTAPLGPDQLGRYERTDNYYVQAARPGPLNTD